jgi:hypothetical protein
METTICLAIHKLRFGNYSQIFLSHKKQKNEHQNFNIVAADFADRHHQSCSKHAACPN